MTRKWFQIHLSTAIVLMIVAGPLLWPNIKVTVSTNIIPSKADPNYASYVCRAWFGWPIQSGLAGQSGQYSRAQIQKHVDEYLYDWKDKTIFTMDRFYLYESWSDILKNIATSTGILVVVAAFMEYLIRREIKKP